MSIFKDSKFLFCLTRSQSSLDPLSRFTRIVIVHIVNIQGHSPRTGTRTNGEDHGRRQGRPVLEDDDFHRGEQLYLNEHCLWDLAFMGGLKLRHF